MEKTREDFLISDSQFSALCVCGGCVGYLQKEHHMRFMVTIAMNFLGEINNAGKGAIKV